VTWTADIEEYIRVKCESVENNTEIARDVIKQFGLDHELESVRTKVRSYRKKHNIIARKRPIKRLFFDIETTYYLARVWDTGKQYLRWDQLIGRKKIICVSYKWQYEDKVHTLTWSKNQDDKALVKKFIKVMGEADEIIAHNGDNFDVKELRTRAIDHGLLMFPTYRTLDTLKKARQYFRFPSNALDYISRFLNDKSKMDTGGMGLWIKIQENNDTEALKKMVEYCERDVAILEDTYMAMAPYIWHNTNFAVLTGGNKWECPECGGDKVRLHQTYTTPMGVIRRNMKCEDCNKQYRISNRTYLSMIKSFYQEVE
jgi:uncharacterized protein YprB with RNaseH-like and TPR domain